MKILIGLLFALHSTFAFSWGVIGHRVVGLIGERHLSPKVRLKVRTILNGASMARASTWPDEIRSEPQTYSHTFPWHYTDWPDNQQDHDHNGTTGTLLKSIDDQIVVIKNVKATAAEKEFAMKFLIHLVGDLHMPLHVGNGLDRGGNNCQVFFHGALINLHQLWDEDMLNFTRLSYTELVDFIDTKDRSLVKKIQAGKVLDWAKESRDLRNSVYPDEVYKDPEQKLNVKNYCIKDIPPTQIPQLSYDYSYKFMPVVERRLLEGGLRLAYLLNNALK